MRTNKNLGSLFIKLKTQSSQYSCFAFFFALIFPFCLFSQTEKDLASQAEKAYLSGNYALSVTLFDSLHHAGFGSCESYFNAGNAYYRLHVPAKSVLNYERALRFCPEKNEILDNLSIVAGQIPAYQLSAEEVLFYRINKNIYGILAIIFTNLSLLFFYLHHYKGKKNYYYFTIIPLVLCLIGYFQTAFLPKKDNVALIISESAELKTEPGKEKKTKTTLSAGTKLTVNEELGEWWEIETNSEKGWIEAKNVENILN